MDKDVLISVIVAVYNAEKYLRECLDSILMQDFEDFEIICINDGSTDKSSEICKEYAKNNKKIRYFDQCNRGLAAVRNRGVLLANGRYICCVDNDDMLKQGCLSYLFNKMEEAHLDILRFQPDILFESDLNKNDKCAYEKYFFLEKNVSEVKKGRDIFLEICRDGDFCCPVWAHCIRKDFLNENGICFDEELCFEDYLFMLSCYMKAERVCYENKALYVYRIRNNSLSKETGTNRVLYTYVKFYDYLLRMFIQLNEADAIYEKIMSLLEFIICQIHVENERLDKREKIDIKDRRMELYYQAMKLGQYREEKMDERLYIKGFESFIGDIDNIAIYGTGKIGISLLKYLEKKGNINKIRCFVVSDEFFSCSQFEGIPVYKISQIHDYIESKYANGLIIIIATDSCLHDDIERSCYDNKITNIYMMDKVLRNYIINNMNL